MYYDLLKMKEEIRSEKKKIYIYIYKDKDNKLLNNF